MTTKQVPLARLTRRYVFSASHRLHNPALTADENQAVYGKCNNPYGHGHNYGLEVTVAGPVHPATGMVVNLASLDAAVEQEVLARFDHTNLNLCAEHFGREVPTSENLCVVIYRLLLERWRHDPALAGTRLEKIRLDETRNNSFEYGPGGIR
jgi:6-pyruvoyltetrahydropterin/6-carboxytetrahydropterin synthase